MIRVFKIIIGTTNMLVIQVTMRIKMDLEIHLFLLMEPQEPVTPIHN